MKKCQTILAWIVGSILLLLMLFLLWQIISLYTGILIIDKFYFTDRKELVELLAKITGGFVLLIGVFLAWKRIEVSQEGQINERFTRAIEQLGATENNGKPKIEIRLGGIYSLEWIAQKYRDYHWSIMEALTAYVRENSPCLTEINQSNELRIDIQAICEVLRRRESNYEKRESKIIDLSNAYLKEAKFKGAKFIEANFRNTYFEEVKLIDANLKKATLKEAILKKANLINTTLKEAKLQKADFTEAKLQGANLNGAYLDKAIFKQANLCRASFKEAKNLTIDQLSDAKTLFKAKLDKDLLKQVEEKHPNLRKKPKPEDNSRAGK